MTHQPDPAPSPAEPEEPTTASSPSRAAVDSVQVVSPEEVAPVGWQAPLLNFTLSLVRHRLLLLGAALLGFYTGHKKLQDTPPFYKASAVMLLLPREKPQLEASISTASLETTEDVARKSESASLTLPPNTEIYITLLQSRAVIERIAELHGEQLVETGSIGERDDRSDEIVGRIKSMIEITGTEAGLLTITITANDGQLAADIANALVKVGEDASKEIERQLILQQAGFLDEAVVQAAEKMREAEKNYEKFCSDHQIIDPDFQVSQTINILREILRRRDDARIKLAQRELFHTAKDVRVQELKTEIEASQKRLDEVYQQVIGDVGAEEYGPLILQYESLRQQVQFRRDLHVTLSAQADLFRIRAQQPAGSIAIIKPATSPKAPAGPSTVATMAMSMGGLLLLGVALSIVIEQWKSTRSNPYLVQRVQDIKRAVFHLPKPKIPLLGKERRDGEGSRDGGPSKQGRRGEPVEPLEEEAVTGSVVAAAQSAYRARLARGEVPAEPPAPLSAAELDRFSQSAVARAQRQWREERRRVPSATVRPDDSESTPPVEATEPAAPLEPELDPPVQPSVQPSLRTPTHPPTPPEPPAPRPAVPDDRELLSDEDGSP